MYLPSLAGGVTGVVVVALVAVVEFVVTELPVVEPVATVAEVEPIPGTVPFVVPPSPEPQENNVILAETVIISAKKISAICFKLLFIFLSFSFPACNDSPAIPFALVDIVYHTVC